MSSSRFPKTLTLAALLLGATAGAACDGDGDPAAMCPGDPQIVDFSVTPTTVMAGGTLDGAIDTHNHLLEGHDDAMGSDAHDDDSGCEAGHVHVYLDDLMDNPLVMTGSTTFTIDIPADVTPGQHTLIARLHRVDHTIIEPQVTAEVTITVQ